MSDLKELVKLSVQESLEDANIVYDDIDQIKLFGNEGVFDSLGFVTLMMNIEENVFDTYEKSITIVDEKAFSRKKNPFSTIKSLEIYIQELLKVA